MVSVAVTATPRTEFPRSLFRPLQAPCSLRRAMLGVVLAVAAGVGFPVSARADAAGMACVESGDTLYVDGHRAYGRCHGGEPVVLYGIDAPELKQTCLHEGQPWPCGRTSASTLLRMTLHHTVTCHGNSRDREGRLIAVCHANGVELNRAMVELGLAVTDGTRYAREEGLARTAHRGMWKGTFERPADWRATH